MAAAFESQKKSARNLVLSVNKQAAYGGALVDAALTRRQRFDGTGVLDLTRAFRTDYEHAGKGTQFATDQATTGLDTKFDFKAELDAWLAGWALAFVMGADAPTGTGGPPPVAPFTHALTFDESTTQAPATTVYVEDTADVKYKLADMALNELTLTIPARGDGRRCAGPGGL
jgi:hypothetical protein